MQIRKILMALAASAALVGGTALAEPQHGQNQGHHGGGQQGWQGGGNQGWGGGQGDRDWRDNRGNWHRDRDRYWQRDFANRGFMGRDRIFFMLRQHNFNRFAGDPYWFQGRYVVKTYDNRGRLIFVEINPYTGQYMGIVRF